MRNVRTDSDPSELAGVDIIVAGGGPDADQAAVAQGLDGLGDALCEAVGRGSALLAICGAFQNLGHFYETSSGTRLPGPGVLNVATVAPQVGRRMVGGVVVTLDADSPISELGAASATAAGFAGQQQTLVGFENHAGRTRLGTGVRALGRVKPGHGNNGDDRTEGLLALPSEQGLLGVRIASYLHGPLLPANPHLADFLILSAVARYGINALNPLDDRAEWEAHAANAHRWAGK